MKKKFYELLKELKEKILHPFNTPDFSSHYIALSSAVGISVGITPFFGQIWICGIIWLALRRWQKGHFSLVMAGAWTFISNPLTTPFFVYTYYVIGQKILGGELLTFYSVIDRAKCIVEETGFGNILKNSFNFIVSDIGLPITIGSLIAAALVAPIAYFISYAIADKIRKKHAKKHAEAEKK